MLGHSCSSFLGAPAFARRVCLQNFARSTIVPSRLSSVPRPGRHIGNLQQTLCQRQHVMGSTQEVSALPSASYCYILPWWHVTNAVTRVHVYLELARDSRAYAGVLSARQPTWPDNLICCFACSRSFLDPPWPQSALSQLHQAKCITAAMQNVRSHVHKSKCITAAMQIVRSHEPNAICLLELQERSEAKEVLQKLLDGSVRCVEFTNNRMLVDQPRSQMAYLPGSFNPLHDGHR